jgi:hypothetical protein
MGLMKKAARRATPRSVRRAKNVVKHPVGTAARAATPRSVRSAKRKAFNATHPINTAENAVLNAATPVRKRRSKPKADGLSGAINAAIFAFIAAALIAGVAGAGTIGAVAAFAVAMVVYVLAKFGEAGGRTQTLSVPTAMKNDPSADAFPKRVTTAWLQGEVPTMSETSYERLVDLLVSRGWDEKEIERRVRALRSPGP